MKRKAEQAEPNPKSLKSESRQNNSNFSHSNNDGDDDNDDMFSSKFNPTLTVTNVLKSTREMDKASANVASEAFDDKEGYYRLNVGDVLDNRYKIVSILGKGVFASVARAQEIHSKDKDDGKGGASGGGLLVALKVLRNNDVMYKAGLKEVSNLEHLQKLDAENKRNCVLLLRHFEFRSHLCLVFENLNMNLREYLGYLGKHKGLGDIVKVATFTRQLFQALSLLREAKIVHADIKPDNILIDHSFSNVKLADFGSASDAASCEITPYLVSRFYRAPEIILGLSYSYPIDIWSMACSLFELYTGKILFQGETNNEMIKLILEVKGKFPLKMLRKGEFTQKHFNLTESESTVLFCDYHPSSGQDTVKKFVPDTKPSRDIKSLLLLALENRRSSNESPSTNPEDVKKLVLFADFLERSLILSPEKRQTAADGLRHAFLL